MPHARSKSVTIQCEPSDEITVLFEMSKVIVMSSDMFFLPFSLQLCESPCGSSGLRTNRLKRKLKKRMELSYNNDTVVLLKE